MPVHEAVLLVAIFIIFAIAYYYSLQVQGNLKKTDLGTGLFQSWLFDSDKLNAAGVKYRKHLIICWSINAVLIAIYIVVMN